MGQSAVQVEPFQERVSLARLGKKGYGAVICYPGTDLKSFAQRVQQMKKLGVKELILAGDSKIGEHGVLGKGCVSVVVRAILKREPGIVFALKIRRTDANRPSMKRDCELQKFANSFGVGPKVIVASRDFFAMEYVESTKIGKWLGHLKTRSSKKYMKKLIMNILAQCYLLDINKLDHGELSNPSKHILIRKNTPEPEAVIIDYESASTRRRCSNLTSVVQFLFLSGWQGSKVRKIMGVEQSESERSRFQRRLIELLRSYKKEPSIETFSKITEFIKC